MLEMLSQASLLTFREMNLWFRTVGNTSQRHAHRKEWSVWPRSPWRQPQSGVALQHAPDTGWRTDILVVADVQESLACDLWLSGSLQCFFIKLVSLCWLWLLSWKISLCFFGHVTDCIFLTQPTIFLYSGVLYLYWYLSILWVDVREACQFLTVFISVSCFISLGFCFLCSEALFRNEETCAPIAQGPIHSWWVALSFFSSPFYLHLSGLALLTSADFPRLLPTGKVTSGLPDTIMLAMSLFLSAVGDWVRPWIWQASALSLTYTPSQHLVYL